MISDAFSIIGIAPVQTIPPAIKMHTPQKLKLTHSEKRNVALVFCVVFAGLSASEFITPPTQPWTIRRAQILSVWIWEVLGPFGMMWICGCVSSVTGLYAFFATTSSDN
jgi:hypothetical protein